MEYIKRIDELLEKEMTEDGYKLWHKVFDKIPPIWDRLTSSTKKHHKKENGRVPSVSEHTYEMLYAGNAIMSMFGFTANCKEKDTLLLAIVLHDAFKYGQNTKSPHTNNQHDKYAADKIVNNQKSFKKALGESQYLVLEEAIRYHSGRWSTDVKDKNKFDFNDLHAETFFVHILDMLSSRNLLNLPK